MSVITVGNRFARWYTYLHTKKLGYIWEGLGMETAGIVYGHLVNFRSSWFILWSIGIFFPVWYVVRTSNNLATLVGN
jgi:hypothetical protein